MSVSFILPVNNQPDKYENVSCVNGHFSKFIQLKRAGRRRPEVHKCILLQWKIQLDVVIFTVEKKKQPFDKCFNEQTEKRSGSHECVWNVQLDAMMQIANTDNV